MKAADPGEGGTGGKTAGHMRHSLLESIVAASLDAIVCADEKGRIILWNPAAEAMFGYTKDEALGRPLTMLLREEDRPAHLAGMRHFMATGEPHHMVGTVTETYGRRKDGSDFVKEMSLAAEQVGDQWVFTAIMRDISERKQVEAELRRRLDEIERMNRLMVGRELKMEELHST